MTNKIIKEFREKWEKMAENLGTSITSGDMKDFVEQFWLSKLEAQKTDLIREIGEGLEEKFEKMYLSSTNIETLKNKLKEFLKKIR